MCIKKQKSIIQISTKEMSWRILNGKKITFIIYSKNTLFQNIFINQFK